jgi:predicted nuclease of predicted toxin-antitoxin system
LRFLIDNALPYHLASLLQESSHDAVHVREYGMQKATDEEIFTRAQIEKRTILSADTDFGTLLASKKSDLPSCILFRDPDLAKAEDYYKAIIAVCEATSSEIETGCLIVVRKGRLRLRMLPLFRAVPEL